MSKNSYIYAPSFGMSARVTRQRKVHDYPAKDSNVVNLKGTNWRSMFSQLGAYVSIQLAFGSARESYCIEKTTVSLPWLLKETRTRLTTPTWTRLNSMNPVCRPGSQLLAHLALISKAGLAVPKSLGPTVTLSTLGYQRPSTSISPLSLDHIPLLHLMPASSVIFSRS